MDGKKTPDKTKTLPPGKISGFPSFATFDPDVFHVLLSRRGAASDVTIHHTKAMSATDPLSRFVYSCIANTKIPTRAAYAIWPRGELLWSDVITPHCHKWAPSLPRFPVNKFPRGPCSFVPAPLCSRWTWNNCRAKSRAFPFLILRVNNILIQF